MTLIQAIASTIRSKTTYRLSVSQFSTLLTAEQDKASTERLRIIHGRTKRQFSTLLTLI